MEFLSIHSPHMGHHTETLTRLLKTSAVIFLKLLELVPQPRYYRDAEIPEVYIVLLYNGDNYSLKGLSRTCDPASRLMSLRVLHEDKNTLILLINCSDRR